MIADANRILLRDPARVIILFLLLTVAFTLPWAALLIHVDRLDIARGFVIHSQMWAPGLAALATCRLTRTPLTVLGLQWPAGRFVALGYGLPVAYSIITYLILWLSGLAPAAWGSFAEASAKSLGIGNGAAILNAALIVTYGVLQSGVSAAGEEIGWRGFLVPALAQRMNFGMVVLVSGLIWAVWHFPLILFSAYNSDAPKLFALACFTVMIVATGALAAWLRIVSRSVWPAIMLHACHNAVIQWLLDPMTVETGRSAWFAGEFGAVLAIVCVIFAALFIPWRVLIQRRSGNDPAPVS